MLADIISYNSAISACERGRQWAMALWLLELLQEEKLQGDLITYNAAISALKNHGVSVMQWFGDFFLYVCHIFGVPSFETNTMKAMKSRATAHPKMH